MARSIQNRSVKKRWLRDLALALCCCSLWSVTQAQFRLQIISDAPLPRQIRWKDAHPDSASAAAELSRLITALQQAAFLEATTDSVVQSGPLVKAWVHPGPAYRWQSLSTSAVPQPALRYSGFREGQWEYKPVRRAALDRLLDRLLDYALNNGFPFAQTGLTDLYTEGDRLSAALEWKPGPLVMVDTLLAEGEVAFKNRFLQRYLGIIPGTPYRQASVLRLRERLRALPYAQLRTAPEVRFQGDKAQVLLDLVPRNASRFDFLIGVLPNSAQVNRLLITGSLEAELFNQLGVGERIYARFEQLRPQTQRLDLHTHYPYLAGLPAGVDARFHFYKRDTAFLDVEADFGIQYLLEGSDYVKAFWIQRSSRLLGFNADELIRTQRLPANLDVQNRFFGLELAQQRLDNRFNPRQGFALRLSVSAGAKRIRPNGRIQELGLANLYDSLTLRSTQYRLDLRAEFFRPVFQRSALRYAFQGRWLLSDQPVLRNEQFRIGGNRLLRGFDEEFFQVTHFAVNTLEYRLLLGENSFLYGFLDAAWAEDSTPEAVKVFYPYGLGAGITFETRAGIFGISLAAGARWGAPLDLNSPKVHLGYVSLF